MCGIVGIIGKYKLNLIVQCLKELQNRGYDSAGLSTINNNEYITFKEINKESIDNLDIITKNYKEDFYNSISHTRWATHGGITTNNCHPHISNNGKINLVHNGIIENYKELKELLIENNYIFYSDTDSEVIVNLIEYYYKQDNNNNKNIESFKIAIEKTINKLSGTWALLIQHLDFSDMIFALKKGSPLIIGKSNNNNINVHIITSEVSGFNNLISEYHELETDKIYIIKNNELDSEIESDSKPVIESQKEIVIEYNIKIKKNTSVNLGNFKHWTLKEIYDQSNLIDKITNNGSRIRNNNIYFGGLEKYKDKILNSDNLLLFGCGTSYNSCLYAKYYIQKLTNYKNILCYDACNFNINDIPKMSKNCCIFVSQSGETKDLFSVLTTIKNQNLSNINIGIINVVDSLIARTVDCGIYLNMNKEVSVASTKIFTAQSLILILLGVYLSNDDLLKINYINDIKNLDKLIKDEIENSNIDDNTLDNLSNYNNGFIIAEEELYPIALETALKFKEMAYFHIEALTNNSLKHGPLTLVSENKFINILLGYNESTKQEILARKGNIINIHNSNNNLFKSILLIIKLQKYCYYLAIKKGINPDFPRNLAKVVTV